MNSLLLQRGLAAAITVFAVMVIYLAFGFEEAGGYAGIGARAFPLAIGVLLLIAGVGLIIHSFTGGFRNLEDEANGEPFERRAFLWVAVGLILQMALIEWAGFAIATALLFWCCARGFGSQSGARDIVISLALAVGVYLLFTRGLSVGLTPGWLPLR
jgi:putative tricarboxylic transport membrane protein